MDAGSLNLGPVALRVWSSVRVTACVPCVSGVCDGKGRVVAWGPAVSNVTDLYRDKKQRRKCYGT